MSKKENTGSATIFTNDLAEKMQDSGERGHYLVIVNSSDEIKEIELGALHKQRITIGRDTDNDIRLAESFISGHHGKFKFLDDQLCYADLGSTNGTYIEEMGDNRYLKGNERYYPLHEGAKLRFEYSDGSGKKSVLVLYERSKEAGEWKRFPLEVSQVKIGRNPDSEIVLSNPSVSRLHALISKKGNEFYIEDQNSLNGIAVNGSVVSSTALMDKDVIQICNSLLVFTKSAIFYKNSMEGVSLSVRNINKFVGREKKQILNEVNCEIGSNEFVAIIGGSGAGKSTLMNAISGFDREIEGNLYCNGTDLRKNFSLFKNMIGYVPQQDIIYENLTLRRMLYYTAKMKMPSDTTAEEIQQRIDQVLMMVELSEHQNTYIRKLSGGQKKRASIAVELLADPSLFFLDEPTSGLDPGTEKKLMQTLYKLSKSQGKTIIMVTHTTQNLHLCDKVIFMGPGGRLCFCGTTEQAKMFFDTDDLVDIYNMIADDPKLWAEQFANCNDMKQEKVSSEPFEDKKKVNLFRQIGILTGRYAELIWNDKPRLILLLLQPILISLLITVVASEDVFDLYNDTKSILFALSCAGIWIGLFNSIQEICKERVILKREYMANLKLTAYVLSKYLIQVLIGLVQAILLIIPFIAMVGKPKGGLLFDQPELELLLLMWLTILASMSMGLVVSGMVKSGDKAMTVAPFLLIIQLLFSGILFKLEGIGSKIAYVTVSKWSVEGLGSLADLNSLQTQMEIDFPTFTRDFEDMFEYTKEHVMTSVWVLLAFLLICYVVCTVVLTNVSKDSR